MLTRLAPSRSSLSSLRTSSSLILLNWLLRLRQVFVNFALQLADCFLYVHQGADGRVGFSVAYAQLGLGHFKFGFPLVNSFHTGASSKLSGLNLGTLAPLSLGFGKGGNGHII